MVRKQEAGRKQLKEASNVTEPATDTPALETLKPNGGSSSKAEVMQRIMALAGNMPIEDLSKYYDDMIAQVGNSELESPNDTHAKNLASISAKPSAAVGMHEAVDEMFAGEELTEEFKNKAAIIFESAVGARVSIEKQRLEEEYDVKLQEEVETSVDELTNKIDEYLDYVITEWMDENEVAIENSLRAEVVENFMEGLKNLFVEHYIEIPEDKVDLYSQLADRIEQLEKEVNDKVKENIELEKYAVEAAKKDIFNSVSENLVKTDVEKFKTLVEGIEFDDVDGYKDKLEVIKENYFKKAKKDSVNYLTEQQDPLDDEIKDKPVVTDPTMRSYVSALSRNIR